MNIVTLAEGDITHLHIGFKGTMNALFLKDLAEKMNLKVGDILMRLLKLGVRASIGADDPDLLDTDLNKEYGLAVDRMGLTMDDLRLANRCAVEGSFLPEDKRQEAAKLIGEKPEI